MNTQPHETNGPAITVRASRGYRALNLRELADFRELLYFLAWRDVKVRYKQTLLGAGWAVLQPVMTMLLFTIVFGRLTKVPSDGMPYPVFAFAALLPWQLFAFALTESSNSLVSSQNLITKVYFPRLLVPVASVLAGLADFAVSFAVLLMLMLHYGIRPTLAMLAIPLLVVAAVACALSVGLWFSALNLKYRDVRYTIPFLTQFWLFATPVAYSSSLVPARWRMLYGLNPMAGVVEGFRWALLGKSGGIGPAGLLSAAMVVLLLGSGVAYFRRTEASFADIA